MKKKQKQAETERMAAFEKDEPMQWTDVKCPICMSIYINAVTFPCKHSVCLRCFNKFIRETSLNCPCCRFRLSIWSRTHIKKNTLVNVVFTERIKKEFPNEVAARIKEIEQEEDDVENGYDGPARVDDSGFNDSSIFENSQNNAPRDGEFCKPGEIGKELHEIYTQHQQELDKERRRKELEEEEASQLLIRQLLREDEPYASQLKSDLELARIIAEEGGSEVDTPEVTTPVHHAPPMLRTNLLNQLQSQNASQSQSMLFSSQHTLSSQGRQTMKPTPKSQPIGKSGTLKGISKAPKRRQPPRNGASSTTSTSKRTCIRSRGTSTSNSTTNSQTKSDKKQTKIGSYFSPSTTPSHIDHDSVIDITPNSSSQRVEHFSSSRKLPWDTPTGTITTNDEPEFKMLNYKNDDDGEAPGPSSWSLRMRSANVANTTGSITLTQTSPVKLVTMTQNSELILFSPKRSKQNSPAKRLVDIKNTAAAAGSSDDNNNNLTSLSPSRLHLSRMSLGERQTSSQQSSSSLGEEIVGGSQSSVESAIFGEEQFEKYREEELALERFRLKLIQEEADRKLAETIQREFASGGMQFRGRGQKESYSIRNWVRGGGNKPN